MTTRLVKRLNGNHYVAADSPCTSCSGCGVTPKAVFIPAGLIQATDIPTTNIPTNRADKLRLALAPGALVQVLFNSFLLPISLVVLAAFSCSLFSLAEPVSILVVLMSFATGIALCRKQSANLLKVEEVS